MGNGIRVVRVSTVRGDLHNSSWVSVLRAVEKVYL